MKIEKCPFCGKQIAEIGDCKNMEECEHFEECPAVEPYFCVVCSINKGGCGASTGYQEGVEKAIAAWNRRAKPENEPLTCEGCEHQERFENEREYGYPSPCTACVRVAFDCYRHKPERSEG